MIVAYSYPFSRHPKGYEVHFNKTDIKGMSAAELGTTGKKKRRRKCMKNHGCTDKAKNLCIIQ